MNYTFLLIMCLNCSMRSLCTPSPPFYTLFSPLHHLLPSSPSPPLFTLSSPLHPLLPSTPSSPLYTISSPLHPLLPYTPSSLFYTLSSAQMFPVLRILPVHLFLPSTRSLLHSLLPSTPSLYTSAGPSYTLTPLSLLTSPTLSLMSGSALAVLTTSGWPSEAAQWRAVSPHCRHLNGAVIVC